MSSSTPPRSPRSLAGDGGAYAVWLSPGIVLVVTTMPRSAGSPALGTVPGGTPLDAETEYMLQVSALPGHDDAILVARLAEPERGPLRLTLTVGDQQRSAAEETDLRTLVRERLAWRSALERERILEFVVGAVAGDDASPDRERLSEALGRLRDTLREPLPRVVGGSLRVDLLALVCRRRYFIGGRVRGDAPVTRLTAVSPEGARVELLPELRELGRPLEAELGETAAAEDRSFEFAGCFTLACASLHPGGWLIEVEDASGVALETEAPAVIDDPIASRDAIASALGREGSPEAGLIGRVAPAIGRLQARIAASVEICDVERLGEPRASPVVTAVIPLAGREDLIEQQLAQLADDASLQATDLVYVSSEERGLGPSSEALGRLCDLYGMSLRLARLSAGASFAACANCGASLARAGPVLLLRPDVIPRSRGWLGHLLAGLEEGGGVGAVSPKLLAFDDRIDHAGTWFRRPAAPAPWELVPRFRGLHRTFPDACVARAVPAGSAACLLVDRDAYLAVDGLNAALVGYEWGGPDVCLRLRESGLGVRDAPEAELDSLERAPYAGVSGSVGARSDAWLETEARGPQMSALMDEPSFRDAGTL